MTAWYIIDGQIRYADLHIRTLARQAGAEVVGPFSTDLEAKKRLDAAAALKSQRLIQADGVTPLR
jgi:hypothetical protein